MRRFSRLTSIVLAALAAVLVISACGQEKVAVPSSDANYKTDYAAAEIFHQRCGGCHTLSYAAANGSGPNPRTYLAISGPNFNERCERPVARVLYAIENGGFSGAYMPANIVVGQQAREVAMFVSKFAGHDAPVQPDSEPCPQQAMGSLPSTATGGVVITQTVNTGTSPGSANDGSHANPSPNN
jgi:mono/diheme cytochrome c family protein